MRTLLSLLGAGLTVTSLAVPAHAAIYSTSFGGTVTAQRGTTFNVGSTLSGAFTYSSDTGRFINFSIDGYSAAGNYASIASASPGVNPYSVLFETQISATSQGGNLNQTFTLDLEALSAFARSTALRVLIDPTLSSQLDPSLTNFAYYSGNANGTNVVSLTASLGSLSTQIPEPATLALLAAPVLGMVFRRRR